MNDHNGVSTKDHLVALIEQLKDSITDQIAELRDDIKYMQTNFVTRAEHDLIVSFLKKEIDRVERESRNQLRDYLDSREKHAAKMIGISAIIASIVVAIIETVISVLR